MAQKDVSDEWWSTTRKRNTMKMKIKYYKSYTASFRSKKVPR